MHIITGTTASLPWRHFVKQQVGIIHARRPLQLLETWPVSSTAWDGGRWDKGAGEMRSAGAGSLVRCALLGLGGGTDSRIGHRCFSTSDGQHMSGM